MDELEKYKKRFFKKVDTIQDDHSCWEWKSPRKGRDCYGGMKFFGKIYIERRLKCTI